MIASSICKESLNEARSYAPIEGDKMVSEDVAKHTTDIFKALVKQYKHRNDFRMHEMRLLWLWNEAFESSASDVYFEAIKEHIKYLEEN